ncbi:MAG TPA: hypothetical protein VKA01_13500 [Vicinamibacteria bacterium]|nr:hypothetical protein [Vicinamibacteria bacterium]
MLESPERLRDDIARLLDVIRGAAGARYACLLEPAGMVLESRAEGGPAEWTVRRFLEPRLSRVFALPASLAGQGPDDDVFEGWDEDDVVLAFLNGRIALALLGPDAAALRRGAEKPFAALADRLLRWKPALRVDESGRGLFFGRPRVDWIVVSRA